MITSEDVCRAVARILVQISACGTISQKVWRGLGLTLLAAVFAGTVGAATSAGAQPEADGQVLATLEGRPGSPSTVYVAAAGTGEGLEAIVYWQQRKGGGWWRWRIPGHGLALKKGEDGRHRAKAVVRVPEGSDCLALQLKLHPPKGQECAFDKIFVGRITY